MWYVEAMGETGNGELVSELLKIGPTTEKVMDRLLCGAARAGHDKLALQLLGEFTELPDDLFVDNRIMIAVARGGCVRTAAAVNDDATEWFGVLSHALRSGRRRFVEWVLAEMEPNFDANLVADAASSGSVELVKWLHGNGYVVGGRALKNAAASGNVDLCKWVSDHGLVPNESTMKTAAAWQHVAVLEWHLAQGCRCTSEVLASAVHSGGVRAVSWCLDHIPDIPDSSDLLALSCRYGRSDVFEYLVDERGFQGSPIDLMKASTEHRMWMQGVTFDVAILVKRYGARLYSDYLWHSIRHEHLGRVRFALSQGQEVSVECYADLMKSPDTTFLNEVLLARTVGGSIPEGDQALIKQALPRYRYRESVTRMLAEHSIAV
jgi:hypothetical protein